MRTERQPDTMTCGCIFTQNSLLGLLLAAALLYPPNVSCQEFAKLSLKDEMCSLWNCKPPTCFCASRQAPNQIPRQDVPQMVLMAFDDAVNEQNNADYKKLFPKSSPRRNPNGCPIAATFFVANQWTVYKMVRQLYLEGHEIASHSVSHRFPRNWWNRASYKDWEEEMEGQRENIARNAGVPKVEVRGARAPFLALGSDTQFEVLSDHNFEYDASFQTGAKHGKMWQESVWPYTLDFYPSPENCDNRNCPKTNFSGFWEVPLNRWIGLDGEICSMLDACRTHKLRDKNDALAYLRKNFDLHYKNNRAPFGINTHSGWFGGDDKFKLAAMEQFLDDILALGDVYIVTIHQALDWMRDPTPLSKIKTFAPWLTCHNKRVLV